VTPIAIVGNLARDLIGGSPPRTGGGAYHCARGLRLLPRPLDARVITRTGDDSLLPALIALDVPVRRLPATRTASFSIDYDGDRRLMIVEAIGESWTPADVAALEPGGWVHVAPLARSDFPAETLARIARGRRVSLDGQGLVRVPEIGELRLDASYDPAMLSHIQTLKLAEEEAEVLGDPAAILVPEVVVTHGSRGATVYLGGVAEHVPAFGIDADPTGAGDAFSIAYVAARAAGLPPVAAARRATTVVADMLTE